jgi:hypothetical protein
MVGDFRQRVKAVDGKDDLTSSLHEKYLRASPDRIAVVNDHHLDVAQPG